MSETSASLLQRVRVRSDDEAWRTMEAVYAPLVRGWLRRTVLLDVNDADDVVQDVMAVVIRRIGEFERQRTGSFRAWLKLIAVNCLRQWLRQRKHAGAGDSRTGELLNELEDPTSQLSAVWDREHDEHVMKQILLSLRTEFTETTWRAFELTALEGRISEDAAKVLGVSVNAVFIAKSRVLARMKQEAAGLIDE